MAARLALAAAVLALGGAGPATAGTLETVRSRGSVRVCVWPEYYGISLRHPRTQAWEGLDIDLSRELGRDLGVAVEYVDSSFATLVRDVLGRRCDVAMFAVAMLPARQEQLRFTRAYLQSDIYAVTLRGSRVVARWEDIDRPGVVVGVQAGTFMEPVMAARLQQARLVRVQAPHTRERELESGRIDVFMTDYPYSRRLLDNADWAVLISPPQPFQVMPYGYAVHPHDAVWWSELDGFVARIQRDGRLRAAAQRHRLLPIAQLP
ncbi:substrate-binding periplasmic protein [Inhella proteolytica]|uniref:substrate-binding periplasmic protein n=1 Tax=Inhella proteolytica TaxID=2795029 RepID=UPI0028736293|nr:ABC transporter substrate-binding protein [Inhella proteolytica]